MKMVPKVGLEPTWLSPPPPQDGVSTNFTTSATWTHPPTPPLLLWRRGRGMRCPELDSNQHTLRHYPLKVACLPISPPGQVINANPEGYPTFQQEGKSIKVLRFCQNRLLHKDEKKCTKEEHLKNRLDEVPIIPCWAFCKRLWHQKTNIHFSTWTLSAFVWCPLIRVWCCRALATKEKNNV